MKLVFDTSVWVEHLRHAALESVFPLLRGKAQVHMTAVIAGELMAGCRSRIERRTLSTFLGTFRRAGRIHAGSADDAIEAGQALSRLRERGRTLRAPGSALLDALIAVDAVRLGATIVTMNVSDFTHLAEVLPLRHTTLAAFKSSLSAAAP